MSRRIRMREAEELTTKKCFEKFIQRQKVKNLSERTIQFNEAGTQPLLELVGYETLMKDVTQDHVIAYTEILQERGLKPISINTYLRGARAFLYWAMEQGYCPTFKVTLLVHEKEIKPTYTDADVNTLIKKPNIKKCSFAQFRTWALICFHLSTGCRLRTAINVKIKDLDFENSLIAFTTVKNRKAQLVPMSPKLKDVLLEYLDYRSGTPEDWLFCNATGEKLTDNAAKLAVRRYNHKHGVALGGIHAFRHTFAKHYVLSGGDPLRLQRLLGHSTLEQTKEYVALYGQNLGLEYDKFNILDKAMSSKERIKMR